MARRVAEDRMFGDPALKKKARDPQDIDEETTLSRRMELLAGMIFANLGGTGTVEETGPGQLVIYMPDGSTWELRVKDNRVNIKGDPSDPNYEPFIGKLGRDSIVDIASSAAGLIHEAMTREPPRPPVKFEGLAGPGEEETEEPGMELPPGTEPGMEEGMPGMEQPGMEAPPIPPPGGPPAGPPMPGAATPPGAPTAPGMPAATPPAPAAPGLGPSIPPMMPAASRRRYASQLDAIADQLEKRGHKDLATRLDKVSNSLEAGRL